MEAAGALVAFGLLARRKSASGSCKLKRSGLATTSAVSPRLLTLEAGGVAIIVGAAPVGRLLLPAHLLWTPEGAVVVVVFFVDFFVVFFVTAALAGWSAEPPGLRLPAPEAASAERVLAIVVGIDVFVVADGGFVQSSLIVQ